MKQHIWQHGRGDRDRTHLGEPTFRLVGGRDTIQVNCGDYAVCSLLMGASGVFLNFWSHCEIPRFPYWQGTHLPSLLVGAYHLVAGNDIDGAPGHESVPYKVWTPGSQRSTARDVTWVRLCWEYLPHRSRPLDYPAQGIKLVLCDRTGRILPSGRLCCFRNDGQFEVCCGIRDGRDPYLAFWTPAPGYTNTIRTCVDHRICMIST